MSRLVKAEWYRLRHSSHLILFMISLSLFCMWLPIIDIVPTEGMSQAKPTVLDFMMAAFAENYILFIPMFLGCVVAVSVGIPYFQKVALYEVMAGNKTSHIILSKLIVIGGFETLFFSGTLGITMFVLHEIGGNGELSQIVLRVVLADVVVLRVVLSSILIVMATRQLAGAFIPYLRFGVDTFFLLIATGFGEVGVQKLKFGTWFYAYQFAALVENTNSVSSKIITGIVGSCILEVAFWYVLAYIFYRKKTFK